MASRVRKKGGSRGEEFGRQAGEVDQGLVEQGELALAIEDRQADGEMREGLGERLHEAAQCGFGVNRVIGGQGEQDPVAALRVALDLEPARVRLAGQGERVALAVRGAGHVPFQLAEDVRQRPGDHTAPGWSVVTRSR